MNCKDLESWLDKAQNGDKDAQLLIIQEFMPYIIKKAKAYNIRSFSYQDLRQLGSLAVIKAIHKYKIGSNTFKGYVIRSIDNALAYAGRQGNKKFKEISLQATYIKSRNNLSAILKNEHSFEEELIYKEEIRQLRAAILRLSQEGKRLIYMVYFQKISLKDIAKTEFLSYNQIVRIYGVFSKKYP